MPSYPSDSIVHRITEHSCIFPGCRNSKLSGASMRRCKQCKMFYCGPECQRLDWPRHKDWCKTQAVRIAQDKNASGSLAEDYDAWRTAVSPLVFTWICTNGLAVYDRPENIQSKFVLLSLHKRQPRVSNARKMFLYESMEVFDRAQLRRVLGGDPVPIKELLDHLREDDEEAVRRGRAGVACLVIQIREANSEKTLLRRAMPVVMRREVLDQTEDNRWKAWIIQCINEGTNVKHIVAEKEKLGQLQL
ncbi:hypothetical protein C8R43DRAFT_968973 [Mycena crocata]|nr:hypothetical protein C8R43DRAFT_968973 [Mycena crocata]